MKNLYQELKKLNLEKKISYPFSPIIYFESSSKCYSDNPIINCLEVDEYPNSISFQDDIYESWADWSKRVIIKDDKLALEVINGGRQLISQIQEGVVELQKIDYTTIPDKEMVLVLYQLDRILTTLYHYYIFYIDECFEIKNQDIIKDLPDARMELSEFVSEVHKICDTVIKVMVQKFEIEEKYFSYATFEELDALIQGEMTKTEFKELLGRPTAFISLDNEFRVLKGDDVVKMKEFLYEQQQNIDVEKNVSGTVAFKGQAAGEVVILHEKDYDNADKILKNKKDFILVTPMTRPEIVPYLKKAAAIVTDEGGITCHAVIVARELKKPCIVGTKNASQVLHDGDMVEVDAEKGILIKK